MVKAVCTRYSSARSCLTGSQDMDSILRRQSEPRRTGGEDLPLGASRSPWHRSRAVSGRGGLRGHRRSRCELGRGCSNRRTPRACVSGASRPGRPRDRAALFERSRRSVRQFRSAKDSEEPSVSDESRSVGWHQPRLARRSSRCRRAGSDGLAHRGRRLAAIGSPSWLWGARSR